MILDIDGLLKYIHPVVKKLVEDFNKEAVKLFDEWQSNAADADAQKTLETARASYQRHVGQMDKSLMGTFQEQLSELAGKSLEEVSTEYKVKLTADDLRLVEVADLEQQVALETMAHKVLNQVMPQLNLLNQRFNEGLRRNDVDDKSNPLGPAMFCANFGTACANMDLTIDQRLDLFKAFERSGLRLLEDLLAKANEQLKSQGILPNAEVVHKSTARTSRAASSTGSEEAAAEIPDGSPAQQGVQTAPVASHVPSGMFAINDPVVKQIFELISKDGYAVLQKLLVEHNGGKETRISSSGLGDADFSEKQELQDDELLTILDGLQKQSLEKDEALLLEGEFQKSTVAHNVGGALQLKSQELGKETTLSKTGSDVVNLVDMLFDFILSDDYLSDGVKSIISELQVPLTKVALMDPTFFSDAQHPARQLLNELSRSGMALGREANLLEDQTVKTISGTVKRIQKSFDKETSVFTEALTEFSETTQKQTKRNQVLEKRLMETEKGRARVEHAEELIAALYAKLRSRVPPSKAVDEFLDSAWRDVLMMTCLKFGSHSKQWRTDSELTKKFMRSILLAKRVRLDGKQMKIPMELLKLLKMALDRISYDALESKRLLSQLAKNYQKIAATPAEKIKEELILLGGELAVAKRAAEAPKKVDGSEHPAAKEILQREVEAASVEEPQEQALSEEERERLEKKAQKARELEEQIEKEKERIAQSPLEALDESIKNLDEDIVKKELVEEEDAPEKEFAPGNTWYDMASQLPIGAWLELYQSGGQQVLRCKLVANIKSLKKLIFVNKAGAKVAERKLIELAQELKEQKARVINDNMIFDQALENVIVNLREK